MSPVGQTNLHREPAEGESEAGKSWQRKEVGARSLGGGAQSFKKGGRGKEVEVVNHQREKAVIRKYRNGRQLKTVTSPGARSMERVMEERGRPR